MVIVEKTRKHGPASATPFDGWFRYPAGFSASTLDTCFEAISEAAPGPVLDCFAGVATVASRAATAEREFVGIEAHPLIAHFASLKLDRPPSPEGLLEAAEKATASARPLPAKDEAELVTRSFSPPILEELLGLRAAIAKQPEPWAPYLELALLSILRDHAQVKVGWPYQLPSKSRVPRSSRPTKKLLEFTERMVRDMESNDVADGCVIAGDARRHEPWQRVRRRAPTALVSSPPYLNNFDYADATRLELYFSKRAGSWAEMCNSVRSSMMVATTQQTTKSPASRALERLQGSAGIYESLKPLIDRLAEERSSRRAGKEYDWMVTLYFHDLSRILTHLRQTLPEGAPMAWVVGDSAPYGVHLDTPALIGVLGTDLGFNVLSEKKIRSRGLRWRTNGTRHQVDLCEKMVLWEAPGPVSS